MSKTTDVLLEVMDGLLHCLSDQLAATPNGRPCFTALEPGSLVSADWCSCGSRGGGDCGMAWTRLDRLFPYKTFPLIDQSGVGCDGPMAATIELGVFRCLPTGGMAGQPPTAEQLTNATINQLRDLDAMKATMKCCPAVEGRSVSIGTYVPRDSGGCGGGIWPITVTLNRTPRR